MPRSAACEEYFADPLFSFPTIVAAILILNRQYFYVKGLSVSDITSFKVLDCRIA